MSTVREASTAQALLQLNGAGKPAGVPQTARGGVAAARLGVLAAGHRSMVLRKVVSGGSPSLPPGPPERIRGRGGPITRHYLPLELDIRAASDGTTPPDAITDECYAWAVRALVGTTLGGHAVTVSEGPSLFSRAAQADYPIARLRVLFIAELAVDPATEILNPVGGREDDPQAPFGAMVSIAAPPLALVDGSDSTYDESRLTVPIGENLVLSGTNHVIWAMEPATHDGPIVAVEHRYRIAAFSSQPLSAAAIQPAIDGLPRGTARALPLDGTPQSFIERFASDPATGLAWTKETINAAKWGWWVELETVGPGSQVSGRVLEFQLRVIA